MTRKQTSAKVSKLAAAYLGMSDDDLFAIAAKTRLSENIPGLLSLFADIRTLAASCLSQDEVKGSKPPQVFEGTSVFTYPTNLPKFTKAEQAALERGEVVIRTEKPRKAKP